MGSPKRTRLGTTTSGGAWGVADIRDKMREHRLRWFDHVMRWDEEDLRKAIQGAESGG